MQPIPQLQTGGLVNAVDADRVTAYSCAKKAAALLTKAEALCDESGMASDGPVTAAISAHLQVAAGWRDLAAAMSTNYWTR